jgi:DNA-binding beta-propeller fold protein YncE
MSVVSEHGTGDRTASFRFVSVGSAAIDYARAETGACGTIPKRLLGRLDGGRACAFVPGSVSEIDLATYTSAQFAQAGVGGRDVKWNDVAGSLAAELLSVLQSERAAMLWFQLVGWKPADPWLRRMDGVVVSIGEDVYVLAYPEDRVSVVESIVKRANTGYASVGGVSSSRRLVAGPLDQATADALADRTTVLLVGAFDHDSYLRVDLL